MIPADQTSFELAAMLEGFDVRAFDAWFASANWRWSSKSRANKDSTAALRKKAFAAFTRDDADAMRGWIAAMAATRQFYEMLAVLLPMARESAGLEADTRRKLPRDDQLAHELATLTESLGELRAKASLRRKYACTRQALNARIRKLKRIPR